MVAGHPLVQVISVTLMAVNVNRMKSRYTLYRPTDAVYLCRSSATIARHLFGVHKISRRSLSGRNQKACPWLKGNF